MRTARIAALIAALASVLTLVAAAAAAAAGPVTLAPIGRLPFPERGYVVDLPAGSQVAASAVRVHEDGKLVSGVQVSPLGSGGVAFGAVLALDASDSMLGEPLAAAVSAARMFAMRAAAQQQIGLVTFNGGVHVLQAPTSSRRALLGSLASPPQTAYGTKIYDGLDRSIALLRRAKVSAGAIVLLSDGADIGSTRTADAIVAAARAAHVRIFSVGLRSGAFRAGPLQQLARETGGTYTETASPKELAAVYSSLGQRLASEYVVRYRSDAAPHSLVHVTIEISGVGSSTASYTAPTPSGLAPFHRSIASRFFLSPAASVLVSAFVAILIATGLALLFRPRESDMLDRVRDFTSSSRMPALAQLDPSMLMPSIRRNVEQSRLLASLERDLELGRVNKTARQVATYTVVATILVTLTLWIVAPILALIGLLTPLITRSMVKRKVRAIRDAFADQLPPNLQVLASSLRVGHSFIGSLTTVVDNAHEPSHSELQRIIVDERIGVPLEEAIRKVAVRMESRDLEQVALLSELQRTAGGNAAEVLDTVVDTLRDRADLRRLVRTLTAQGRMARWILSSLPPVAGLVFLVVEPEAVLPMFQTGIGQMGLVLATVLVVSGSLVIQKIVDIKV